MRVALEAAGEVLRDAGSPVVVDHICEAALLGANGQFDIFRPRLRQRSLLPDAASELSAAAGRGRARPTRERVKKDRQTLANA
jgi:hypothetical protein